MSEPRSKRITFSVTPEMYDRIAAEAALSGVSINAWIAVTLGTLVRNTSESRERVIAAAEVAFAEAIASGEAMVGEMMKVTAGDDEP